MRGKILIAHGLAMALLIAGSIPAMADPPWERGDGGHDRGNHYGWRHHHHDDDDDDDEDRYAGPPPWFVPGQVYVYQPQYAPTYVVPAPQAAMPSNVVTCQRDVMGTVIGAAAGGVLGNQLVRHQGRGTATIGGAIVGALVGGSLGRAMDVTDQACIGQVLEYGQSNQPIQWADPNQGAQYQVVPTRTYQGDSGQYCREYQTRVIIDGRTQQAYGTACRQPDGSWQAAN